MGLPGSVVATRHSDLDSSIAASRTAGLASASVCMGFSSVALGGHQTTRHRSPLAPHVIFCDLHSPWQKGSVENANGRVRRFLPRESPPEALARARFRRLAGRPLNDTPPALPRLSHAA